MEEDGILGRAPAIPRLAEGGRGYVGWGVGGGGRCGADVGEAGVGSAEVLTTAVLGGAPAMEVVELPTNC